MQYPVFIHVQKPSKLYGMNIEEAGLLMGILLFFLVLGIIISSFFKMPWWYYPIVLVLVIVLGIIFRRSSKKDYPDYLLSYISYYFMQAWSVEPKRIDLSTLPSLSYYKDLYQKTKEQENEKK